MPDPSWYEEIDHTGDAGVRVTADNLATLFERAAWAMFNLITDMAAVEPRMSRKVTVDAGDRDALFVRWLSELNFIHITEGLLFASFRISELDDGRLEAEASGEHVGGHVIHTEIKAVTYHGLAVEQHDGRWTAQVIFDL